jgi:hypothetical protein
MGGVGDGSVGTRRRSLPGGGGRAGPSRHPKRSGRPAGGRGGPVCERGRTRPDEAGVRRGRRRLPLRQPALREVARAASTVDGGHHRGGVFGRGEADLRGQPLRLRTRGRPADGRLAPVCRRSQRADPRPDLRGAHARSPGWPRPGEPLRQVWIWICPPTSPEAEKRVCESIIAPGS